MKLFGLTENGVLVTVGMSETPALFSEEIAQEIAQNKGYQVVPVSLTVG